MKKLKITTLILLTIILVFAFALSVYSLPQENKIIARYEFNELSGNIIDQKNNNDLTNLTEAIGYAKQGLYNLSYNFTRSPNQNPFQSINNFNLNPELTIHIVYRIEENNLYSGWTTLLGKPNGTSTSYFDLNFGILVNPKFNNTMFRMQNDIGQGFYIYTDLITPTEQSDRSKFYEVTGTFDGTTGKVYRNGSLRDLAVLTASTKVQNSDSKLIVGSRDLINEGFGGQIDQIIIWNISLTQEEIQSINSPISNESINQTENAFDVGSCPNDTVPNTLMFAIFFLIAFGLILMGFLIQVDILAEIMGMFGGILLMVLSWYIAVCIAILAWFIAALGLIFLLWFSLTLFMGGQSPQRARYF